MRANFTQCAAVFSNNQTLIDRYGWKGPVHFVDSNPTKQISFQGCIALCGTGVDYYEWNTIASNITTWILPIIGIILQAPFESNDFFATVWALARWIGSPIASLSYVFWNIMVSSKCAEAVDMSSSCMQPGDEVAYQDMRDSLYLLSAMNQYSVNPEAITSLKDVGESLLRFALFSKELKLKAHKHETRVTLTHLRKDIARKLRDQRKRGAVPVFVSIAWFLFSLAISIQYAFGLLGQNGIAHDLAIGLLMSWLPVIILASIVDRNFSSPESVRKRLNSLVNRVCDSLEALTKPGNEQDWEAYIQSIRENTQDTAEFERMRSWVRSISERCGHMKGNFFGKFAGQGRLRWHYGVAHPIMTSIERSYLAKHKRPWLRNEREARSSLVLGTPAETLIWFDRRQIWQVFAAWAVVWGSVTGAFCLSFFTPTVGLGCRSGAFMIFAIIALVLALSEFLMWAVFIPTQFRNSVLRRPSSAVAEGTASVVNCVETMVLFCIALVFQSRDGPYSLREYLSTSVKTFFGSLKTWTGRQWWERCFFRFLECVNMIWLSYAVIGQAVGAYGTCACQCSTWSPLGGYLDFTQYDVSDIPLLRISWPISTAISTSAMGFAMIYIVREWCIQSHLSTQSVENSMSGLKRTRRYRSWEQYTPLAPMSMWRALSGFLRRSGLFSDHLPNPKSNVLIWQWDDYDCSLASGHQGSAVHNFGEYTEQSLRAHDTEDIELQTPDLNGQEWSHEQHLDTHQPFAFHIHSERTSIRSGTPLSYLQPPSPGTNVLQPASNGPSERLRRSQEGGSTTVSRDCSPSPTSNYPPRDTTRLSESSLTEPGSSSHHRTGSQQSTRSESELLGYR